MCLPAVQSAEVPKPVFFLLVSKALQKVTSRYLLSSSVSYSYLPPERPPSTAPPTPSLLSSNTRLAFSLFHEVLAGTIYQHFLF